MKTLLCLHLTLSALIFSVYPLECFENPKAWLLYTTAALLCLGSCKLRRLNPVDLALLTTLGAAAICTVTSTSPRTSLLGTPEGPYGLLTVSCLFVIYAMTKSHFKSYLDRRALIMTAVAFSTLVSVYALIQFTGHDPLNWTRQLSPFGILRPFGTLGQPNFLSGYLVMLFPFAVLIALETSWGIIPLGLMLPVIFLAQSRSAWVAAGISSLIMGAAVMGQKNARRLAWVFGTWIVFGIILLDLYAAMNSEFLTNTIDRLSTMFSLGLERQEYWKTAVKIWWNNPWLGHGTDTFKLAFEHARSAYYWSIQPAGSPDKAHNDFLQVLATQGLLGATAWLGLLAAVIVQLKRSFRGMTVNDPNRLFTIAIFASLTSYYIQNLSGFPSISTGVLFMTLLAMLNPAEKFSGSLRWAFRATGLALILTTLMFLHNFVATPLRASTCAGAGHRIASTDALAAVNLLDYASKLEPANPHWPAGIGFIAEQVKEWDAALHAYTVASQLEPREAIYLYKVATLSGDRAWLYEAIRIEPNNPIFTASLRAL